MKKLTLGLTAMVSILTASAQNDTILVKKADTLQIGNILIIKRGSKGGKQATVVMGRKNETRKKSRVTTNYGNIDLGFANYDDRTIYPVTDGYIVPGSREFTKSDLKLKAGKSINVNIWFFMQRLSLIKQNVNLKYGLGVELNNYRFKSSISFKENGPKPYSGLQTSDPFIFRDSIAFSKNKLAADYLTIPLMLNFVTNNIGKNKGLSVSLGVSAGYLYSQRNKQKSNERGKEKNKGDYDLERFKLSYIAELGLGPVKLYGTYSPKSIYEHSLDIRPYAFGFRIGN